VLSVLASLIPTDLVGLVLLIVVLVILWIIVSIPAYLAGKIVTGGKSTLGEAMAATVLGPIVYIIVRLGIDFFLAGVLGGAAIIIGYVLAFLAWIWVYKSIFKTGWLGGLAIAILAIIVFVIFSLIVGALFGLFVSVPSLQTLW